MSDRQRGFVHPADTVVQASRLREADAVVQASRLLIDPDAVTAGVEVTW